MAAAGSPDSSTEAERHVGNRQ